MADIYQTGTVISTAESFIYRVADKVYIPPDPKNKDYIAYQAWRAAGNTPGSYTGG